jgi:hypothetical protein
MKEEKEEEEEEEEEEEKEEEEEEEGARSLTENEARSRLVQTTPLARASHEPRTSLAQPIFKTCDEPTNEGMIAGNRTASDENSHTAFLSTVPADASR